MTNVSWANGEPNNWNLNEKCAAFDVLNPSPVLYDVPCSMLQYPVCTNVRKPKVFFHENLAHAGRSIRGGDVFFT